MGNFDMCMLIVYSMVYFDCINVGVLLFDFFKFKELIFIEFDFECYLNFKLVIDVFFVG